MPETLRLIVEESHNGAAQRHNRLRGWRFESGDHANQVAEQDKKRQGHEKRRVAVTVVADNLLALALNKIVHAFKNVLQGTGFVDRQAGANHEKKQQQDEHDQQLHGDGVGNGRLRMFNVNVQRLQHGSHGAADCTVQKLGKPELFSHKQV